MAVNYPRAWQLIEGTPFEIHHPNCSYVTSEGCILCDCDVLEKHPETLDPDNFYTLNGEIMKKEDKRKVL